MKTVGELIHELSAYDGFLPVVTEGLDGSGYVADVEVATVKIQLQKQSCCHDFLDIADKFANHADGSEPYTTIYIGK